MKNTITKETIVFWLVINKLYKTKRKLEKQVIINIAGIKLFDLSEVYDTIVAKEIEYNRITQNYNELFLTNDGLSHISSICKNHSLNSVFYNEYYRISVKSSAHSKMCHKVYGIDLNQHGMADTEQINLLLEKLDIHEGMNILEFGCGNGKIAEHIANKMKIKITGIDIANNSIKEANERTKEKNNQFQFICMNVDKESSKNLSCKYDRVIAIDSFFFVKDQKETLEWLLKQTKHNGLLGIFYISPPKKPINETTLYKIVSKNNIEFSVVDLTENNRKHWDSKKEALLELKNEFISEGNINLYNNRIEECNSNIGDFHRHLYIIKNTGDIKFD